MLNLRFEIRTTQLLVYVLIEIGSLCFAED